MHLHQSLPKSDVLLDLEMRLKPGSDRILEAAAVISLFRLVFLDKYEPLVSGPRRTVRHGRMVPPASPAVAHRQSKSGHFGRGADAALCDLADATFRSNPVILAGTPSAGPPLHRPWLPRFSQRLHYRMLDVSSFKIVSELFNSLRKTTATRTGRRIGVMAELRYYIAAIDPSRSHLALARAFCSQMGVSGKRPVEETARLCGRDWDETLSLRETQPKLIIAFCPKDKLSIGKIQDATGN
jgi:oligoribonuclease